MMAVRILVNQTKYVNLIYFGVLVFVIIMYCLHQGVIRDENLLASSWGPRVVSVTLPAGLHSFTFAIIKSAPLATGKKVANHSP
jgi:hypothetical protein